MVVFPGLWVFIALVSVGCSRSEAAPNPSSSVQATGAAHETENYRVAVDPVGTYERGKPAEVKIVLVTKGDYHINDQYPYKFVVQDPPAEGVSYLKKSVLREDGTFGKSRAEMPIRFTPARSGSLTVGGVLSLSVCTASNCLLDKRPLELTISVR